MPLDFAFCGERQTLRPRRRLAQYLNQSREGGVAFGFGYLDGDRVVDVEADGEGRGVRREKGPSRCKRMDGESAG